MNYFMVCWRSDFDMELGDDRLNYASDNEDYFNFIKAKSKEEAMRLFLQKKYDRIYLDLNHDEAEADDWDGILMRAFLERVIYGDDDFEEYEKEDLIENLSSEIYDRFLTQLFEREGLHIQISASGENTYSIPGNVDVYVDMLSKEFHQEDFFTLLTEKEKEEFFIQVNKYELYVVELTLQE